MQKFDIWMEGFHVMEAQATAKLVGKDVEAITFKQACMEHFKDDELYDPLRNTLWGCTLFDNEIDARKQFG